MSAKQALVPHVEVLAENAVAANLGLAALGAAVFTTATVALRR
ncbi:hypothetical protein [Nocardiopsis coralli]|nr:hypothetical protein [Nocardiopsis coralli]